MLFDFPRLLTGPVWKRLFGTNADNRPPPDEAAVSGPDAAQPLPAMTAQEPMPRTTNPGMPPVEMPGKIPAPSPFAPFDRPMTTSYGAICSDFIFETKITVKMPLPSERDTVMHFFERVKKSVPTMDRFRKFDGELILETARNMEDESSADLGGFEAPNADAGTHADDAPYRWVSLRERTLRCGIVNPETIEEALKQHDLIVKNAPHFLGISPLDIDSFEMTFVFELEAAGDHDEIVKNALFEGSPLAEALANVRVTELQPIFSFALSKDGRVQTTMEVQTRRKNRRGITGRYANEPLRVLLSLRRLAPFNSLEDLDQTLPGLFRYAEQLAESRLIPHILTPISRQISASQG